MISIHKSLSLVHVHYISYVVLNNLFEGLKRCQHLRESMCPMVTLVSFKGGLKSSMHELTSFMWYFFNSLRVTKSF